MLGDREAERQEDSLALARASLWADQEGGTIVVNWHINPTAV
jgi:hypothetical protein